MSRSSRARVRARFRLGPWVPGVVLPVSVALLGVGASLLVLREALLLVGLVLSVAAAVRVRSAAPWLLVAALVLGRLLLPPAALDAGLPALVLLLHLLVVVAMTARAVPVRSRLQLAALGPAARMFVLIQVPAQALAALLLASAGRLPVLPVASVVGAALLVLVTGLLVVPRRSEELPRTTGGARADGEGLDLFDA